MDDKEPCIVGKDSISTKQCQLVPFSAPHIIQSCHNSPVSCELITASCLLVQAMWCHVNLPEHSCMSDNAQRQAAAIAACAPTPELLVNVYCYHVMVKTVSCYCVYWSLLLSYPVIYNLVMKR